MPALLLPAVRRPRRQARIAFPADHLLAVVLAGERLEGRLDDAAAQTEDEVEGGFLCTRARAVSVGLGDRCRKARSCWGSIGGSGEGLCTR